MKRWRCSRKAKLELLRHAQGTEIILIFAFTSRGQWAATSNSQPEYFNIRGLRTCMNGVYLPTMYPEREEREA